MDITEDVVNLVAQKLLGSSGPGGTDLEALQGWLLKFREDRKRLRNSVKTFVDWLANGTHPGRPIVNLCLDAWSLLENSLDFFRSGWDKRGYDFSLSVCWGSQDLKPQARVSMNRFVPELNWELTALSTGFKIFGTLSRPWKIGGVYF